MSVSVWRWTEECDGRICVGDCDVCSYAEESEEEMQVVKKDAVIINRTIFCTPEEAERVRQKVIQQIRDDGVAMLPVGFTAVVCERDCLFLGGEEE